MKYAVLVYPGFDNDTNALNKLKTALGAEAEYIWHNETSLYGFDGVFIGGGASYGNYLRAGAIAARSDITPALLKASIEGLPIIGVGNGFQILTEIGLLPGYFQRNQRFMCRSVKLKVETNESRFTGSYTNGECLTIPIANGHANYQADEKTLEELKADNRIVFKYMENPTGSVENIAGIVNEHRNVLGMLPQPERAVDAVLGNTDGLRLFESIKGSRA